MSKLYVVVALNSMGPVVDPKHNDLLTNWDLVNAAFLKANEPSYRFRYPDDDGNGVKFSLFCISWSGFTVNPVYRDFGWHTIFDNYKNNFNDYLEKYGDGLYWMYNHPPASGIANEWGLDWLHNTHYLDILNHFIIDREFFPNVVEIPTERNDASHFLEQWIPYDFGNRNSLSNNLNTVNADGKMTGEVIDWRFAPHDWSHYNPSHENYQKKGKMNRNVFRILDIKSIIHKLSPEEIERAFVRSLEGNDTVICAYEHDFRDRYETIMELMIKPINECKKKYPEVKVIYSNARDAAQSVLGYKVEINKLDLSIEVRNNSDIRIQSTSTLFGRGPYSCVYNFETEDYIHIPLTQIGEFSWHFPKINLPEVFILGLGACDKSGNSIAKRLCLKRHGMEVSELSVGQKNRLLQTK